MNQLFSGCSQSHCSSSKGYFDSAFHGFCIYFPAHAQLIARMPMLADSEKQVSAYLYKTAITRRSVYMHRERVGKFKASKLFHMLKVVIPVNENCVVIIYHGIGNLVFFGGWGVGWLGSLFNFFFFFVCA